MSQKIKDIPLINQKRYYEVFMAHDKDYEFMWCHYRIHSNTMKAIARNELKRFIKEKREKLEEIRRRK